MIDWQEAERRAADYLTQLGFTTVEVQSGGSDGGVDVRVPGLVVAQVKATNSPVGRPVIQQIFGIAKAEGDVTPIVFSLSGFSQTAIDWADEHSVALFIFSRSHKGYEINQGYEINPVNLFARGFIQACSFTEIPDKKKVPEEEFVAPDPQISGVIRRQFQETQKNRLGNKINANPLRSVMIGFLLIFIVVVWVASCTGDRVFNEDDADQKLGPSETESGDCPTHYLNPDRVCSLNADADGLCESIESMPPEIRPPMDIDSGGRGPYTVLCPYGYRYIEP